MASAKDGKTNFSLYIISKLWIFFFLTCICYLFKKKKKTKLKNNQPLPNIKKPGRQPKNVKILRLHMTVKLGQRKKRKDENFQFGWGDVSHSPLH